jgi:hypothetical protein
MLPSNGSTYHNILKEWLRILLCCSADVQKIEVTHVWKSEKLTCLSWRRRLEETYFQFRYSVPNWHQLWWQFINIRKNGHWQKIWFCKPTALNLERQLLAAQPLRTFPAFYGAQRFITMFTKICHWLVSARWIQSTPCHPNSLETILILKNIIFWDVMPCDSCKNRHLGGTQHLHHQGKKNWWARKVNSN